jgi:hypothetical protein
MINVNYFNCTQYIKFDILNVANQNKLNYKFTYMVYYITNKYYKASFFKLVFNR